ncbi:MAG: hypothetical protein PHF18_14150 [Methanosarcina sp.]|uniref:PIN domain-containing protein n=1 Tax=Methanosarcina sp. TaxID=2213 RepID=UPI002618CA27|nr:hypothetical protein [Methanosarcina sp.]MDD3247969.1 hypothetical protein [Methanosarcina sp.]MDD4248905.1 hypothetical protein [Methanosarcina sp.]
MDAASSSFLTGVFLKVVSSIIYSTMKNSKNKILNYLFSPSSIEKLIYDKVDFKTVIEKNIEIEDFQTIVNLELLSKFLKSKEVRDIIHQVYDNNSVINEDESLSELKRSFSLLFVKSQETQENEDLFILGSQIFNALIEACNKAFSDSIICDESLSSHEAASIYREKVLRDDHLMLHQEHGYLYKKMDQLCENIEPISNLSKELLGSEYQTQMNTIKEFLDEHNPTKALESLNKLKNKVWDDSSPKVKYNLLRLEASANLQLDEYKNAGKCLLQARQFNSDDEKAKVNAAFGFLILGDKCNSDKLALDVVKTNPANARAYSILIKTGYYDNLEQIPCYLRDNQDVALALGYFYYKKEELDEAKKWLEIAIENETENIIEARPFLASVLLERVLSDPKTIRGIQLNTTHTKEIERSIELFTVSWNSINDQNLRILNLHWLINRGIEKRLLGDIEGSKDDINSAFNLDPSNSQLLKFKALIEFESGEFKKVIDLLKDNVYNEKEIGNLILYFESLKKLGKFTDVINEINDFLKHNPQFDSRDHLERLLIYNHLDLDNFDEARKLAELRMQEGQESIQKVIDLSRVERRAGNQEKSISILNKAKINISGSEKYEELLDLADEFLKIKQFEDACAIYEIFVNATQITELTHKIVEAYYLSGNLEKSLGICKNLRSKFGPIIHITNIEIAIYNEINWLEEEKKVLIEYIEHFPQDIGMKINLAILNQKCNNYDEVDTFLKTSFNVNSIPVEQSLNLAILFNERGLFQKSIELLYELRRNNFDNEKVHLQYINLMLYENNNKEWLHPEKVDLNSVVVIEERNGREQKYIIENREDTDSQKGELNIKSAFYKKIAGKSVGDKISVGHFVSEEVTIKEIKSKYVYVFQESFEQFNYLFPNTPALSKIYTVDKDQKEFSPEVFMKKIKESFLLNAQHKEKAIKYYLEKRFAIWDVASICGRDIYELWSSFIKDPNLGIYCFTGNRVEQNESLSYLKRNLRLIIDPISVLTLISLNVGDIILNHCGKFGVAQSTIDLFQHIKLKQSGMSSRDHMSIIYKDGDIFFQQITADAMQEYIEQIQNILDWIDTNCEVMPCKKALSIKREKKKEYDNLFGRAFIDTILIASEEGNLLYSDEQIIRNLAKQDFNTYGIWTQSLLFYCLNENLIQKDQFNEKTIELVNLHYYHTVIDSNVLLEAAKKSGWKMDYPFISVLNILGSKYCDENSALNVSSQFIYLICKERIPIEDFYILFFSLLNTLVEGRWPPSVLNNLKIKIVKPFDLFSSDVVVEILKLIETWDIIYYGCCN